MKKNNILLAFSTVVLLVSCGEGISEIETNPTTNEQTTTTSEETSVPTTSVDVEKETIGIITKKVKEEITDVKGYTVESRLHSASNEGKYHLFVNHNEIKTYSNKIMRAVESSKSFSNATLEDDGPEDVSITDSINELYENGDEFYFLEYSGHGGILKKFYTDSLHSIESSLYGIENSLAAFYNVIVEGKSYFENISESGSILSFETSLTTAPDNSYMYTLTGTFPATNYNGKVIISYFINLSEDRTKILNIGTNATIFTLDDTSILENRAFVITDISHDYSGEYPVKDLIDVTGSNIQVKSNSEEFDMANIKVDGNTFDKESAVNLMKSIPLYAQKATNENFSSVAVDPSKTYSAKETINLYNNEICVTKGERKIGIIKNVEGKPEGELVIESDTVYSKIQLNKGILYQNAESTNKESSLYHDFSLTTNLFYSTNFGLIALNEQSREYINGSISSSYYNGKFDTMATSQVISASYDSTNKVYTVEASISGYKYLAKFKDNFVTYIEADDRSIFSSIGNVHNISNLYISELVDFVE